MKLIKLVITSCVLLLSTVMTAQDDCAAIGWANYDGQTFVGSPTGGGNATPIEVTTFAQLKAAAESADPKVIYVKNNVGAGYLGTTGDVLYVKSNKTIIGYAGVTVRCSWQISNVSNIIIRNLTMSGPGNSNSNQNWDAVNIQGSKRIWVDHCTVIDGEDGNFDVVKGSDNVSVTWCIFTYTADGTHNLSNLIGSSDNEPESWGKLNITYVNCWWKNVNSRTPRARYGKIHVLNSYISNSGAPRAGYKSNVIEEGSYFENINTPIGLISDGGEAGMFPIGCKFVNCSGNTAAVSAGGYTAFTIPYSYNINPVDNVKALITDTNCGAGPTMDSPTQCGCATSVPIAVTGISVSPATASIQTGGKIQLTASVTPSNADNKTVTWSSADPAIAAVSATGLVTGVSQGTTTITAATADGSFTVSANITVTLACPAVGYEAELGTNSAGTTIDTNHAGFTGTGFVNTNNAIGAFCEITVNVPAAGSYNLSFRYGNGTTVDRPQSVEVNGISQISTLGFPGTGAWTTWGTADFSLNLTAGNNTVRFISLTANGAANLDCLDVYDCSLLGTDTFEQDLKINLYPNPVSHLLTIELEQEYANQTIIELYDTLGKLILKNKAETSSHTLNLRNLNAGVYIVKVSNGNKRVVKRIVKQ